MMEVSSVISLLYYLLECNQFHTLAYGSELYKLTETYGITVLH